MADKVTSKFADSRPTLPAAGPVTLTNGANALEVAFAVLCVSMASASTSLPPHPVIRPLTAAKEPLRVNRLVTRLESMCFRATCRVGPKRVFQCSKQQGAFTPRRLVCLFVLPRLSAQTRSRL